MVVVIAFFICWAPVYIERVLFTVSAINLLEDGLVKTITHNILINVSQVLYYSSSIINPILYNIMSKKFRKAFKVGKIKKNIVSSQRFFFFLLE